MPLTYQFEIPPDEELTVEEVNLSTPSLKAGAYHFGKYCDEQCKEFMLCRREENDPRKCLDEGKMVTACAMEFFRKVKKTCRGEFEDYANCIDKVSGRMEIRQKTQVVLDRCMLEKMYIPRPELGYFARPRSHHTERPRPAPLPKRKYVGVPDEMPPDYPLEPGNI